MRGGIQVVLRAMEGYPELPNLQAKGLQVPSVFRATRGDGLRRAAKPRGLQCSTAAGRGLARWHPGRRQVLHHS